MNSALNPGAGSVIFNGKFLEGKAVIDIIFKEVMPERFRASFGGKTASAVVA